MKKLDWKLALSVGALCSSAALLGACGSDSNGSGSSTGGTSTGGTDTGGSGGSDGGSGGTGGSDTGGSSSGGSGGGTTTSCTVTPPSSWSAPNWEANTETAFALRELLAALAGGSSVMRGGETGDSTPSVEDLSDAFEEGEPSLHDVTTEYFRGVMTNTFEEFVAAVAAGEEDFVSGDADNGWNWQPPADGAIWTGSQRVFNKGGLELRQIADKGLFAGAGLYNYALQLTTGTIDEATIDSLAALFGANPDLNPGRSNDPEEANRNLFSANYVFAMGFYSDAKDALIAAKAYAADEDCTAERDDAIQQFFRTWEQGVFARVVFYSAAGVSGLEAAADANAIQGALHQHAEGIGLAMGFYGVPDPESGPLSGAGRVITDEDVENLLDAIGIKVNEDLAAATFGEFVEDTDAYGDAVKELEGVIAEAFGWSDADIESFHNPTEG